MKTVDPPACLLRSSTFQNTYIPGGGHGAMSNDVAVFPMKSSSASVCSASHRRSRAVWLHL